MKNLFLSLILTLLCITCFTYKTSAQAIQAEAKLQQYTIRIGDQTKLFLSARQPAKAHLSFPKLEDTIVSKVRVVSTNKPDTTFDPIDKNAITVTQSYTITSFEPGSYRLPAFKIASENTVTETNELTLDVETVKVDTTKSIYDIKQPMQVDYTWLDWLHDNWYWIAGPLVIALLIAGLIIYLRKRPKPAPTIKQESALAKSAHAKALEHLEELRGKQLWQQGEVKQYYVELSDILREYVGERYLIKTQEKTTDELFDGLRHILIKDEDRKKLRQVLTLADLVKFAKEKPTPAENEESIEVATEFVVNTQETIAAANDEGGQTHV